MATKNSTLWYTEATINIFSLKGMSAATFALFWRLMRESSAGERENIC